MDGLLWVCMPIVTDIVIKCMTNKMWYYTFFEQQVNVSSMAERVRA